MPHIRKRDLVAIWEACDRLDRAVEHLEQSISASEDASSVSMPLDEIESCVLDVCALLPKRPAKKIDTLMSSEEPSSDLTKDASATPKKKKNLKRASRKTKVSVDGTKAVKTKRKGKR